METKKLKLTIRRLQKEDYGEEFLRLLKQQDLKKIPSKKVFEHILKSANTIWVVALNKDNNQFVAMGTLLIEQKLLYGGTLAGYIEDIIVDKRYKQSDIGKDLVEAMVDTAKNMGCYKVGTHMQGAMTKTMEDMDFKKFSNYFYADFE